MEETGLTSDDTESDSLIIKCKNSQNVRESLVRGETCDYCTRMYSESVVAHHPPPIRFSTGLTVHTAASPEKGPDKQIVCQREAL